MFMLPEKRQQIIDDVRLFQHHIKMEYQKIRFLLDTTFGYIPTFTEKWVEVYDQCGGSYK